MKKLLSFAMTTALMFGLASCSNEIENEIDGANGNAAVQFSFKTNKGNLVTRAIANDDEMALTSVDIYAFSGGNRLGDGKLALGSDIKVTTGTGTINYAATSEWLAKHAGKTVNFYFVANDASSTGGAHISTISAKESDFVELVTKDVPKTGELHNKIVPDLLFSQAVKGVELTGKVQKEVTLSRRVARFDIVNELYKDFTVNNIKVSNANVNGYIFGDATGKATINAGQHVEFAGLAVGDYDTTDPDEIIAESVFYLYPTTTGTLANGETEILINATIGGETDNYLVKTNMEIKANHRYKLILDPLELEFYIVAGDWEDDGELETGFGKDTKITLSDVSTDNRMNTANNVLQFDYTGTATFTFKTTTVYGTRARINYLEGSEDDLKTKLEVKRTSATDYTRAAFETVDSYTITIPEADAGKFNIEVEIYAPGNAEVKKVFYFKRGIWNGVLKTEPETGTYTYNGKTYDVFEIDEASKLAWLSDRVNNKKAEVQGKNVLLTGDIDLANETFDPIGYQNFGTSSSNLNVKEEIFIANPLFTGSVFGDGHTISNVKLTSNNRTGRGLFAHVIGTTSTPVVVDGVNIDGILVGGNGKWSGGLIGYVRDVAQISNCSVNRIAIGTGSNNGLGFACGALVGFISSTSEIKISNCSTSYIEYGPIGWNNSGFIGKLVNNGKVTIENCSPSEGYCHTYLPLGEANGFGYTGEYEKYNTYFLGADGYNNSWFIGNITWTNGMKLIINNVKDNSANWSEWTKNKGAGTNITANEREAAVAWPYVTAFDGYKNMTSGSIMIDGVALTLP